MHDLRAHPLLAGAALLAMAAVVMTAATAPLAAEKKQAAAQSAAPKPDKAAPAAKGEQAIVVLVNDEPVTAYEIDQRAAFLSANSGSAGEGGDLKAKAEARWAQIIKDPKTNERFQQYLREKNVRTEAEARALQKQYVTTLQRSMLEQLKREARASGMPRFRKEAQEELIDDRLKLQEAKRLGIQVAEDEVNRVMKGVADRNKMTLEQFQQNLKGTGIDPSTMRERMRAQFAWREVVRRKFSMQVSISQRDVDRMISASASEAGQDSVELQVQRITLLLPGKGDQGAIARRLAEADALRRKFGGCKTMAALAKEAGEARHDDLKFIKPSSIAEPTRSLLLSARDGDILPPATTEHGVEVFAVCGRRAVGVDDKQREKAEGELAQKEFEIVAKRYLRDLRQDAHIEYR
jgi:peptidyl-prolyl cis-trans isomerase SurA